MRWLVSSLGLLGGIAAGHLGLRWLDGAARQRGILGLSPVAEHEAVMLSVAAYVMVAAMVAAAVGGLLAWQQRGRAAGTVLLFAGVVPGIVDLRAFVVTCVLILAAMLAYGIGRPPGPHAWSGRISSSGG